MGVVIGPDEVIDAYAVDDARATLRGHPAIKLNK